MQLYCDLYFHFFAISQFYFEVPWLTFFYDFVDCLAKYVEAHPEAPPGARAEHRLAAVRKHLRSYFTEAGHCGKRPKTEKALGIKE